MNPQTLQAIAAIIAAYAALLGGLYAVVTRPLQAQLSEMSKRMDDVIARLTRIESKLDNHESRITTLEAAKWGRG